MNLMTDEIEPVLVSLELEDIYVSTLVKMAQVLRALDAVVVAKSLEVS